MSEGTRTLIDDWGIKALTAIQREPDERARFIKVLARLVHHDEAADWREGLPGCVELEAARDLLEDILGPDFPPPLQPKQNGK